MKNALIASLLFLFGRSAGAQEAQPYPQDFQDQSVPVQEVQPAMPQPTAQPPAPPQQLPPPPPQQQVQVDAQPMAQGQWVYTAQYGWIWMPYGLEYTSLPMNAGADPYEYVYYPNYGWTWLVAPWVYGMGVRPYFGHYGVARFGWYRAGFYRTGVYRGYRYPGYSSVRYPVYSRVVPGPYRGGGHPGVGGGHHFGGGHMGGGHFGGGHRH